MRTLASSLLLYPLFYIYICIQGLNGILEETRKKGKKERARNVAELTSTFEARLKKEYSQKSPNFKINKKNTKYHTFEYLVVFFNIVEHRRGDLRDDKRKEKKKWKGGE